MAAGPKGFSKKCVAFHEHKVVFFFFKLTLTACTQWWYKKRPLTHTNTLIMLMECLVFLIASVLSNSIEKVSNYQTSDNLNQTIQNIQIICICLSSVSASTQAPWSHKEHQPKDALLSL